MITHITMYNKLFKLLIKKNMKYIQFNQFFIYHTHNKNEIRESPKIKVKMKENKNEKEI